MRVLALSAAILAFAACTARQSRPPPPLPPAHHPVSRSSAPRPTRTVPAPGIAVVGLANYESEHRRIKSLLAHDSHDSLAPSEVGYYMDVLQGRLKQIAGKGIGLVRSGDRIELGVGEPAAFAPGSAEPGAGTGPEFVAVGKVLVEYDKILVTVRVRSDDADPPPLGSKLAEQRALALAHDLADTGVAEKRILATSLAMGSAARIEVIVEPIVRGADSSAGVNKKLK